MRQLIARMLWAERAAWSIARKEEVDATGESIVAQLS